MYDSLVLTLELLFYQFKITFWNDFALNYFLLLLIVLKAFLFKFTQTSLFFLFLRYKLHTIKFTCLKCTVQVSMYSQSCASIATVYFRISSLTPKRSPVPSAVTPHIPPRPHPGAPRQPFTYFWSLQICLFWAFHTSWIL